MTEAHVVVTPPERRVELRLRDGRRLAWSEWGPVDGAPVLFCTGAGMSGWLGFGTDVLPDLRLRLLAIDRPGLGRSDPHPTKTLASWAEDVGELVNRHALAAPLVVGFSQGAPFALALASAGLARAVALVSGQDELAHPRVRPHLAPPVAAMVDAAERDATGFEQEIARSASSDWLWRLVLDMSSERDRAVYGTGVFGVAYEQALREGFAQGAGPYARDVVNAMRSWPFALENIDVPVDLWYGGQDTSPVHSPDFGATLAERLPRAARVFDVAEGSSILWTRAGDILSRLKSADT